MSLIDRIIKRIAFRFATMGTCRDEQPDSNVLIGQFLARCQTIVLPRVLELGTKRSLASRSTRHDAWIPHAREYLGTDIETGPDVDLIADVHELTRVTGEERFDIIISASTFEHFKYPHLAAHEVMKALRVGGVLYVQTHQSFPLHAYPHDHFRFSREALSGLFGTRMGFRVLMTDYIFRARLYSPREPILADLPAYLNVSLFGEKTDKTPATYVYELDTALSTKPHPMGTHK